MQRTTWKTFAVLAMLGAAGCRPEEAPPTSAPRPAPELTGGVTWLNSSALTLADLHGKVVLLNFFEYSCVNCLRVMPYLREWQRRYGGDGLVIIGVHTPEYDFSASPANVMFQARRLELTWPIVVDSDLRIATAYQNTYWPRTYLIDGRGQIRYDHVAEGGYPQAEWMIQKLLREAGVRREFPRPMSPLRDFERPGAVCYPITPELHLGYERGRLANGGRLSTNETAMLEVKGPLDRDRVVAAGVWSNHGQYLRHARDADGYVDFVAVRYRATAVSVVMKPEGVYWLKIYVKQDGNWLRRDIAGPDVAFEADGASYVKVDSPRLYRVIDRQPYGTYDLRLYVQGRGLSVYAFSFGTCAIPENIDRLGVRKGSP